MLRLCLLLALQDPSALADRLRSDRIEERDSAARELLKLGKEALPTVQALLSDEDPEVVLRARWILREQFLRGLPRNRVRLEEALTKAKSVHVRFTFTPAQGKVLHGELWVKGDRFRGRASAEGEPANPQITSDGHQVRLERCTVAPKVYGASEGQGADLLIGMVRVGLFRSLTGAAAEVNFKDIRMADQEQPPSGVLRHIQSGRCGDRILHELTLGEQGIPKKRTVSFEGRVLETETYEIVLDEDIPDDTFALGK